jgi:hypothetical protein
LCLNQVGGTDNGSGAKGKSISLRGRCGAVGWQGLKIESGDIVDLTPRARQDRLALRKTPFQERDDEDGTLGQPMIYYN